MAGASAIVFIPDDTARTGLNRPLLLTQLMGDSLLSWLCGAMYRGGVRRLLLVCRDQWAAQALGACPKTIAAATAVTGDASDSLHVFLSTAESWEEVVTVVAGPVIFDRWTAFDSGMEPSAQERTPCGVCDVPMEALLETLDQDGEEFDFVRFLQEYGVPYTDADGLYPISTRQELLDWRAVLRQARIRELEAGGVDVWDPACVWVGPEVTIAPGAALLPGSILRGCTAVGEDCVIGPDTLLDSAVIGAGAVVRTSQIFDSAVGAGATVGPYACLRPGSVLGDRARLGAFSEVKNATLGAGSQLEGLGYLGEAVVDQNAVLGRGVITADHDGQRTWRTTVGQEAWIGPGATLCSPVDLGDQAYVAPGSAITENVPDGALGAAVSRQLNQKDYIRRQQKKK